MDYLKQLSENGFNRTFMELKLMINNCGINRNNRFNRTFMELKYRNNLSDS